MQDRESRRILDDSIAAADFREGRLLKSKTIPLTGLEPGDFHLAVTVRHSVAGPALASINVPLRLVNDRSVPPLYVSANTHNLGRGGVVSYIRALEASAQKDENGAADYMQRSLDQNPANSFAGEFLVRVYFRQRNYGGVADLYHKLGISPFKSSSQTLAAIGLSCWKEGRRAEARKVMAEARAYFPEDPLLKSAVREMESHQ
jgi:hypothetical protein